MALILGLSASAQSATDQGSVVYAQHCAQCHDSGAVRIPSRSVLQTRSAAYILNALDSGLMKQQGSVLSSSDRIAVARWIGRKTTVKVDHLANACKRTSNAPNALNAEAAPSWPAWGGDSLANLRFQSAEAAGLSATDVPRLKLKWAFAVPDVAYLRSQPAIYAGTLIFAGRGTVYSLDASTGCTQWATDIPSAVRSSISIGAPDGVPMAFFGDSAGAVYALNAATGAPVWQTHADAHPAAIITGTPAYYKGRLYVPVSSYEEVSAIAPDYLCCTFRGSVLALDAKTGGVLWKTFTIDDQPRAYVNKNGRKSVGPSGSGIWSPPTIDSGKGVLYVTTGDNYSDPPGLTSDAVLAISLDTGKLLWSKQLRSGDAYTTACLDPAHHESCPDANGPDFDFGSPAMLTSIPNGRRALILSQKSGTIYAVDPDDNGKLLWQSQLGHGGVLGGVEWGSAADGARVYAAIADEGFLAPTPGDAMPLDPAKGGGIFALRLDNGERLWMTPPPPCGTRRPCSPAQPGPVSVIPGAVFSGSLDGHIRAYSTVTGKIVWDFDTAQSYAAVNGITGHGGSLNAAGPVIVNGFLYTLSGYDQFGGAGGNVLLAFTVDGK